MTVNMWLILIGAEAITLIESCKVQLASTVILWSKPTKEEWKPLEDTVPSDEAPSTLCCISSRAVMHDTSFDTIDCNKKENKQNIG